MTAAYKRLSSLAHSPYLVLVVLMLIGASLRFYHLGTKSLWSDEAISYRIASADGMNLLALNAVWNSAPPLYPLLLHGMISIDDSETGLRFPSAVVAIISIPTMYVLAKRFTSHYAAAFAALLTAVSLTQIVYAQTVREYSLTFLLTLLILIVFTDYLTRPTIRRASVLSALLVIGILTQYGFVPLIIALNAVYALYWLRQRDRDALLRWVLIQLPGIIAAIIVFVIALRFQWRAGGYGAVGASTYLQGAYWDGSLKGLARFTVLNTGSIIDFSFDGAFTLLLLLLGIVSMHFRRQAGLWLMLAAASFAITFVGGILRFYPYSGVRQDIYLIPFILTGAAVGIDYLIAHGQRLIAGLIIVMMVAGQGAGVYSQLQSQGGQNIKPILTELRALMGQEDQLYVYYGSEDAWYYYMRDDAIPFTLGIANRGDIAAYFPQLETLLNKPMRTWLVMTNCYEDECDQIVQFAGGIRSVELVAQASNAWLYRAD